METSLLTNVSSSDTFLLMKQLDTWMTENDETDESFGQRIGRSRLQVFKYRHGLAVPRKDAMESIGEVTKGQVNPSSFYAKSGQQSGRGARQ